MVVACGCSSRGTGADGAPPGVHRERVAGRPAPARVRTSRPLAAPRSENRGPPRFHGLVSAVRVGGVVLARRGVTASWYGGRSARANRVLLLLERDAVALVTGVVRPCRLSGFASDRASGRLRLLAFMHGIPVRRTRRPTRRRTSLWAALLVAATLRASAGRWAARLAPVLALRDEYTERALGASRTRTLRVAGSPPSSRADNCLALSWRR